MDETKLSLNEDKLIRFIDTLDEELQVLKRV